MPTYRRTPKGGRRRPPSSTVIFGRSGLGPSTPLMSRSTSGGGSRRGRGRVRRPLSGADQLIQRPWPSGLCWAASTYRR